jgi:sec-independent protein translocase protein TatA
MAPCIILFLDSLGGGELLLIFVVVLILFGPKSIPGIAKGMGKATREFRNAMNDVRSEIENSMEVEEKKEVAQKAEEKPAVTETPDLIENADGYKPPERKVFGQDETKS